MKILIIMLVFVSIFATIVMVKDENEKEKIRKAKKENDDMIKRAERIKNERIKKFRDELWRECDNWRKGGDI